MPRIAKYSGPGTLEDRGTSWRLTVKLPGGKRVRERIEPGTPMKAVKARAEAVRAADRKRRRLGLADDMRVSALLDVFTERRLKDAEAITRERGKRKGMTPATIKEYAQALARFRRYFVELRGDPLVSQVNTTMVEAYLEWRRRNPGRRGSLGGGKRMATVSAYTLRKDRVMLHRVLGQAVKDQVIGANPAKAAETEEPIPREYVILSEAEYLAVLEACALAPWTLPSGERSLRPRPNGEMLHTFIVLCAEAGLRHREALQLRWEDVELPEKKGEVGMLEVKNHRGTEETTKTHRSRPVPMSRALEARLREHFARFRFAAYGRNRVQPAHVLHHVADKVGCAAEGRTPAGSPFRSLLRGFKEVAAYAVELRLARGEFTRDGRVDQVALATARSRAVALRVHDLRHRRVTTWVREGHNLEKVRRAMGHSSLTTTQGYMHLVDEDLKTLVMRETKTA